MKEEFSRTNTIVGENAINKLNSSKVIIFGLGGVGGHAAEALARAGIGHITLVDNDTVSLSNINRQIVALHSTVGKYKTEVLMQRFKDINPDSHITAYNIFYAEDSQKTIDLSEYDYIIDAIDSVKSKILLIKNANESNTPIISSMGTGNKTDAAAFKVSDIYKTSVCPLAKTMRTELKKIGIKKLKCVYSEEIPSVRVSPPGSMPYVPAVAGLIIAGEVIKDIIAK